MSFAAAIQPEQGDKMAVNMLAKELVRSRNAKDKIHTAKAQINSITMEINAQAGMCTPGRSRSRSEPCYVSAMLRVAGTMQKSGAVMAAMNQYALSVKCTAQAKTLSQANQTPGRPRLRHAHGARNGKGMFVQGRIQPMCLALPTIRNQVPHYVDGASGYLKRICKRDLRSLTGFLTVPLVTGWPN